MPRLLAPTKEQSQLLPAFRELPASAIHTPNSAAEFASARAALLAEAVLGFDTESKPLFNVNQIDTGPHLVQFASRNTAWLLQMHHAAGRELACEILANPKILKAGFGLDNDRSSMQGRLGLELQNLVDLDRVFKRHGYGNSVGVRAAIALVMGQNFHKSKRTSTSNWSVHILSDSQKRYAANDAHGPAMVQAALAQWEAAQPEPPQRRSNPKESEPTSRL